MSDTAKLFAFEATCRMCGNEFEYDAPADHTEQPHCNTCTTWFGKGGIMDYALAAHQELNKPTPEDTPMTAPTTGADETLRAAIEEAIDRHANDRGDWLGRSWSKAFASVAVTTINDHGYVPATAVPDGELRASVRRLKEISEYASAVLILEGGFGRPTAETKGLTALLDARTLPHDWERTAAWLAHGGRDGK